MAIKTAYSMEAEAEKAAADLSAKLSGISARFIVFFASSAYDPEAIASAMRRHFSEADIIGCSTAGEIASGKMLTNSVVAMCMDSDVFQEVRVGVVENLKAGGHVSQVFADFEGQMGQKMVDLDPEEYVGIILVDGLSAAEEQVIERIGDLTNVIFVGGSAGDDLKFLKTYVYADGKSYTDAAVVALLKPKAGFEIVKTQSFCDTNKVLTATRVEEGERRVLEFNGEPAVEAYASAVGVSVEEADGKFMTYPVGLMIDGEPYVRSPQQFRDDSIVFYCAIHEGMDLHLLESTQIVEDTRAVVQATKEKLGGMSGLINFHCILRTLYLEEKNQTDTYGMIFHDLPAIGFSTYGEQYLGHINQTSTMLVFK